ncbi:MAG: C40 family peptidase [Micromonosporaceae bacterium]
MAKGGVSLPGLVLVSAGAVLVYAGVEDAEGGPIGVVTALLQGRAPTPGVRVVTDSATGGAAGWIGHTIDPAKRLTQAERADTAASAGGSGASVVGVAQTYLGVPYRFGGASRSGIDCSGLGMVAYRDGAGIALPHRATAQAARGRRVPRGEARPGDLVAWGVPGNYPHIALVVDSVRCIAAWTWGRPVSYGTIDHRAVPGFGLPDIIRILG